MPLACGKRALEMEFGETRGFELPIDGWDVAGLEVPPRLADHFRFAKEVADIARGCSDSLEIDSEKEQEWEPRKAA